MTGPVHLGSIPFSCSGGACPALSDRLLHPGIAQAHHDRARPSWGRRKKGGDGEVNSPLQRTKEKRRRGRHVPGASIERGKKVEGATAVRLAAPSKSSRKVSYPCDSIWRRCSRFRRATSSRRKRKGFDLRSSTSRRNRCLGLLRLSTEPSKF